MLDFPSQDLRDSLQAAILLTFPSAGNDCGTIVFIKIAADDLILTIKFDNQPAVFSEHYNRAELRAIAAGREILTKKEWLRNYIDEYGDSGNNSRLLHTGAVWEDTAPFDLDTVFPLSLDRIS